MKVGKVDIFLLAYLAVTSEGGKVASDVTLLKLCKLVICHLAGLSEI